ncbi:phosphatase PAP2 family protein [Limibacter armeniacum]|uniref:phosphatase PAP2 family protein n=1 Tax=Limibacter armeniacum TaxID=466084 RepID=UPI002FE58DF6
MKNQLSVMLCICLCIFTSILCAQQPDSLNSLPTKADILNLDLPKQPSAKWYKSTLFKTTVVPVALIGGGMALWNQRDEVKALRDQYFADFHTSIDDHMHYAPIAAVYGLNLFGVKGRNGVGKATLCLLASYAIASPIVAALKKNTNVTRPSGGENSFPSWHTTRAFVAASFLHKEYGKKSIWYSIGGYTVATATGVCRSLNNAHWVSDILVGAGIGILTTEASYLLMDWASGKLKKRKLGDALK